LLWPLAPKEDPPSGAQDFYLIMTDAPGEKSYPVTATVFVLMYKQPKDPERAGVAVDLAMESGQEQA
jgi:phosphate transport system substrate-binding protein